MNAPAPSLLVTGAGSGIGRAVARLFLAEGWRVALVGRRRAALEETAQGRPAALAIPCDVACAAAVDAAFAEAARALGRLDALFNNAGIFVPSAPIDEVPVEDWRALLAVNVDGAFLCARAAFGIMRRQTPQGGRIINNGSISAHAPRHGSAAYTTSKHAITGLTRSLALDGRPFGIAAGQIDVGNALTDMVRPLAAGVLQPDGATRAEPVMDVEHVARAVLHMATLPPEANVLFMTIMATDMPHVGRG